MLRFSVGRAVLQLGWLSFPYGTLIVNALGSFLIGYFAFALQARWGASDAVKTMIITGFLGGFTTFSAFSLEVINIIEQGALLRAFFYVFMTLGLCLFMCALGLMLAKNVV